MLKKLSTPSLGILGGGQLAKMLEAAAGPLGVRVRILAPSPDALIPGMFREAEIAAWTPEHLARFAETVDVLALENEFVNPAALEAAEATGHAVLLPSAAAIRVIQDKLTQKQTLRDAGLPVPEFRTVATPEELIEAGKAWGWPVVLKKRCLGYDGKGNATVRSPDEADAAFRDLGGGRSALLVEQFCRFERELAVMVVRGRGGETRIYPVVETRQKNHICHEVLAPAPGLPPGLAAKTQDIAIRAVEAFGLVGSAGVELFEMPDGTVVINEMAPRVHNSGHYTIEACRCSQFENHVRAVLGLPLGDTAMTAPAAVMINLLGASDGPGWPTGVAEALAIHGVHLHIYGKAASKPGRKMGHLTVAGTEIEPALAQAREAAGLVRFG